MVQKCMLQIVLDSVKTAIGCVNCSCGQLHEDEKQCYIPILTQMICAAIGWQHDQFAPHYGVLKDRRLF